MKYVLSIFACICVALAFVFCVPKKEEDELVRLHVVANSTSFEDSKIKYEVKDGIVNFLGEKFLNVKSSSEAKNFLTNNMHEIENVVQEILSENGAKYGCDVKLTREKIPTRCYGDTAVEGGEYASLTINLGRGEGENWWCMVFPTVCFEK